MSRCGVRVFDLLVQTGVFINCREASRWLGKWMVTEIDATRQSNFRQAKLFQCKDEEITSARQTSRALHTSTLQQQSKVSNRAAASDPHCVLYMVLSDSGDAGCSFFEATMCYKSTARPAVLHGGLELDIHVPLVGGAMGFS